MAWVYRYTDLADGVIKYVGVVWGKNRTLEQRLREHERHDSWCNTRRWKIEYLHEDIETRAEAEAFETHFIELYETGRYFNKRQVGYGLNKFLPNKENEWKEYKLFFKVAFHDKNNSEEILKTEAQTCEIKQEEAKIDVVSMILEAMKSNNFEKIYSIIVELQNKKYTLNDINNVIDNNSIKLIAESASMISVSFVSNEAYIKTDKTKSKIERILVKNHHFVNSKIPNIKGEESYCFEFNLNNGPRYYHYIDPYDKTVKINPRKGMILDKKLEEELYEYLNNIKFNIEKQISPEKCIDSLIKRITKFGEA